MEMSSPDRRYFPRWEVNNKVFYKKDRDRLSKECVSRDINCTGASILTGENLSPQQKLKLAIYLDKGVVVHVTGKVCWVKGTDQSSNLIGVVFDETTKKAQDLILKYAFELNKEKLIQHWFHGWEGVPAPENK